MTSLTPMTSGNIVFTAGAATKLVYTTVPSTGTAGTAFSVTVQSQDANGNPANLTSATTITLSKATGGGTLERDARPGPSAAAPTASPSRRRSIRSPTR